jgi:hypothetical protein
MSQYMLAKRRLPHFIIVFEAAQIVFIPHAWASDRHSICASSWQAPAQAFSAASLRCCLTGFRPLLQGRL